MISHLLSMVLLQLPGGGTIWTIVGVLAIIALLLYIIRRR